MRRLTHGRVAAFVLVIIFFTQIFVVSSPASATSLYMLVAQAQRAAPTPTLPPPPPVIDVIPLGPLTSTDLFPFPCEYLDFGEGSGAFVTPFCDWFAIGVGGTHSEGRDLSFCLCAQVDVGILIDRLLKD